MRSRIFGTLCRFPFLQMDLHVCSRRWIGSHVANHGILLVRGEGLRPFHGCRDLLEVGYITCPDKTLAAQYTDAVLKALLVLRCCVGLGFRSIRSFLKSLFVSYDRRIRHCLQFWWHVRIADRILLCATFDSDRDALIENQFCCGMLFGVGVGPILLLFRLHEGNALLQFTSFGLRVLGPGSLLLIMLLPQFAVTFVQA